MKIADIQVGSLSLSLAHPFKTALRTVERIEGVVVRVIGDDGSMGCGEALPLRHAPPPRRAGLRWGQGVYERRSGRRRPGHSLHRLALSVQWGTTLFDTVKTQI